LYVVCSSFHTARLKVIYTPADTAVSESCNKAYYDIRGSTIIDFTMPYQGATPWSEQATGFLNFIVESQLIAGDVSTTPPATIFVVVNSTHMRFAKPNGNYMLPKASVTIVHTVEGQGLREDFEEPFPPLVDDMVGVDFDGYSLEPIEHLGMVVRRPQREYGTLAFGSGSTPGCIDYFPHPRMDNRTFYIADSSSRMLFPTGDSNGMRAVRPTYLKHFAQLYSYMTGSMSMKAVVMSDVEIPYDRRLVNATLVDVSDVHYASVRQHLDLSTDDARPHAVASAVEGQLPVIVPSNDPNFMFPTMYPRNIRVFSYPDGVRFSTEVPEMVLSALFVAAADDFRLHFPHSPGLVYCVYTDTTGYQIADPVAISNQYVSPQS